MSDRILAQGIAESVARMTPPARPKHRPYRARIGRAASFLGWLAVASAVLFTLRAFAH